MIKQNTVLPLDFKITKCPLARAAGRSVYRLELEQEARLAAQNAEYQCQDSAPQETTKQKHGAK